MFFFFFFFFFFATAPPGCCGDVGLIGVEAGVGVGVAAGVDVGVDTGVEHESLSITFYEPPGTIRHNDVFISTWNFFLLYCYPFICGFSFIRGSLLLPFSFDSVLCFPFLYPVTTDSGNLISGTLTLSAPQDVFNVTLSLSGEKRHKTFIT